MSGAELTDYQLGKHRADRGCEYFTSNTDVDICMVRINALLNLDQWLRDLYQIWNTSWVRNHHERLNSIQDTGQGAAQVFGIEGGEAFVEEDQVGAL